MTSETNSSSNFVLTKLFVYFSVWVLLSACAERFSVPRMQYFLKIFLSKQICWGVQALFSALCVLTFSVFWN